MSWQQQARDQYYTPEEANAALPRARALVQRMASALEGARNLVREFGVSDATQLAQHPRAAEVGTFQREILEVQKELSAMGVEVKGSEPVLLDFPGLRFGVEVCLCWREGEERIDFWHPHHSGVAGRAPLANTPEGAWFWSH